MGKFQIFVLLSVVTCAIISTVQSVPVSDSSVVSENAANCKKLCGLCGCTGYYCGEECLCECNSQTGGEAICVDTMKSNCKKMELPFEVLIQGPNVNRMVRSLLYADPDEEICVQSSESNQKKRSTISIYKPDLIQQQDEILPAPKIELQEAYSVKLEQLQDENIQTKLNVENMDHSASDAESNSDSLKLPAAVDAIDRTNIKRHIVDINQDISEFAGDSDYSFLYKRDADVEEKKDDTETKDETVGAAAPQALPSPPETPTGFMPKFREAIQNIRARIPTSDEIRNAWEGVRKELNGKINEAIAEAQRKAADLRSRITPPPPPAPAAQPAPPKFNPFLRSENEGDEVAMPLIPVIPILPVAPIAPASSIQAEIAKTIAANRAAAVPFQTEIAKTIASFRNRNNALINNLNKNLWLASSPVLGSTQEEGGTEEKIAEEPVKEEEKKEE